MLAALEQKKFVDGLVEHFFDQPREEFPKVYAKPTHELKSRLRFLCYRGIRQAVMDFWDFDKKLKHMPYRPSDHTRYFDYFDGFKTVQQRVKVQLMQDPKLSNYLRHSVVSFDGNCENIALLTQAHYLDKLSDLTDHPKE